MWQCWQVAALTGGTARVWAGREETRLNEDMWQTRRRGAGAGPTDAVYGLGLQQFYNALRIPGRRLRQYSRP